LIIEDQLSACEGFRNLGDQAEREAYKASAPEIIIIGRRAR
jgi:hypothetical protein